MSMTKAQEEEIAQVFRENLERQYVAGFTEGSKSFASTVLTLIASGDTLEDIRTFCETGLGINKERVS